MFNELELVETSGLFSTNPLPASHITGLKQIYGVWVSPNMQLYIVVMLLYYFGVGNHRYFVLDFYIEKFLGEGFILIYKPEMRRLTTKQPKVVYNYIQRAETLFHHHQIEQKL